MTNELKTNEVNNADTENRIEEKFKVYKPSSGDDVSLHIFNSDKIENLDLCDCYGKYGQHYSCEDVCGEDIYQDGEFEHTKVEGYNFWDGSNWQTITFNYDEHYNNFQEIEEEEQAIILKELQEAEFFKSKFGVEYKRSCNYEFCFSQFATDPFLCEVRNLQYIDDEE